MDSRQTEIALRLDRLTELSIELSYNRDVPALLERLLRAAKRIAHADGGTSRTQACGSAPTTCQASRSDLGHLYVACIAG